MNRRGFLGMMIGGIATAAAVRTFPFRVFSFPKEIKIAKFPVQAPLPPQLAQALRNFGPMFNATVSAVVTAEQAAAAVGKQTGSGASKLASVVTLMGPLISQGLKDAGKASDDTAVQGYVNSVVAVLNAAPAPSSAS